MRPLGRLFLSCAAVAIAGQAAAADRRPNIVFFLVDDLHAQGTGASGHPFAITPNIDRIAHEGIRFDDAHVTTPLCSPSRASFLSGMYARAHGVIDNRGADLDPGRTPSFPQYLKAAGYATAFVGKWHQGNGNEPRPGFDMWAAFSGQGEYVGTSEVPISIRYVERGTDRLDEYTNNEYNTDILTYYARSWLDSLAATDSGRPFCLLLWYKAVHGPRRPADRHAELYTGQHFAPLPPSTTDPSPTGKPELVADAIVAWNRSPLEEKQRVVDDVAIRDQRALAAVDESVGDVLALLEDLGILDDTVVIFASDNGYFFHEFGLIDKRWQYEPSTRIPLFIRYPRLIEPGATSPLGVLNIDIAPTLLDLAGVPVPLHVQGRSLLGLLDGSDAHGDRWRRSWLTEYFEEQPWQVPSSEAVTIAGKRGTRKVTSYPWRAHDNELYDLDRDPYELDNLLPSLRDSSLVAELRQERARLASMAGGPDPPHPFLDCFSRIRADGVRVDEGLWLRLVHPADGQTEAVEVEGRKARRTIEGSGYIYLDVQDDWASDGDRSVVDVTVVYHDRGSGELYLQYDSTDPAGSSSDGAYRPSIAVQLDDTGEWRSHTFRLIDAGFGGRQNGGADLRVAVDSNEPLSVDQVVIHCARPRRAEIDLGETDAHRLLFRVEVDDSPSVAAWVAGRDCRGAAGRGDASSISFAVADELAFAGNGGDLIVEVEVYDEGYGTLTLEIDGSSGPYTVAGAAELHDTLCWKRHRFVLRDWVLANRQANGADLRLVRSEGPLLVDRMWVLSRPPPRPAGRRVGPAGP